MLTRKGLLRTYERELLTKKRLLVAFFRNNNLIFWIYIPSTPPIGAQQPYATAKSWTISTVFNIKNRALPNI